MSLLAVPFLRCFSASCTVYKYLSVGTHTMATAHLCASIVDARLNAAMRTDQTVQGIWAITALSVLAVMELHALKS